MKFVLRDGPGKFEMRTSALNELQRAGGAIAIRWADGVGHNSLEFRRSSELDVVAIAAQSSLNPTSFFGCRIKFVTLTYAYWLKNWEMLEILETPEGEYLAAPESLRPTPEMRDPRVVFARKWRVGSAPTNPPDAATDDAVLGEFLPELIQQTRDGLRDWHRVPEAGGKQRFVLRLEDCYIELWLQATGAFLTVYDELGQLREDESLDCPPVVELLNAVEVWHHRRMRGKSGWPRVAREVLALPYPQLQEPQDA